MDMDHAAGKKSTDRLAAAAKKKPTTLLDAYEVECIRRELERLVVKQNNRQKGSGATAAPGAAHGHHPRHHGGSGDKKKTTTTSGSRKVKVSPSTAPAPAKMTTKGARHGGGVRLLGRHAVAICSGIVPVSAGGGGVVVGGGRRRRGGCREVEKV